MVKNNNEIGERNFLTFEEVQGLLKLSRSKLYQMLQGGELPAYKIGKQWRIEKSELDRWISSKRFIVATSNVSETSESRKKALSLIDSIGEVLKAKGVSVANIPQMIESIRATNE